MSTINSENKVTFKVFNENYTFSVSDKIRFEKIYTDVNKIIDRYKSKQGDKVDNVHIAVYTALHFAERAMELQESLLEIEKQLKALQEFIDQKVSIVNQEVQKSLNTINNVSDLS